MKKGTGKMVVTTTATNELPITTFKMLDLYTFDRYLQAGFFQVETGTKRMPGTFAMLQYSNGKREYDYIVETSYQDFIEWMYGGNGG